MKKKLWIWGIIIVLLLVSLPGLFSRWDTETSNNTYEIIIPYEEIAGLTKEGSVEMDEALSQLEEAGLNAVSLEPVSLQDMENSDILTVYESGELEDLIRFSDFRDEVNTENEGYFVTVPEEPAHQDMVTDFFQTAEVMVGDVPMYFIPENDEVDVNTDFTYDTNAIEQIKNHDLRFTLRVENDTSPVTNEYITEQLLALKDENISSLLFSGTEALGYDAEEEGNVDLPLTLNEAGYSFYMVENTNFMGLPQLAKYTDYDTIRMLSINPNTDTTITFNDAINQAERAIKERNIRSIFYHIPTGTFTPEESLESTVGVLEGMHAQVPGQYEAGAAQPFEPMNIPAWVTLAALLAGVVFTYQVAGLARIPYGHYLQIAAGLFMLALAGAYFLLDKVIFIQGFALIIAILTPTYAVLATARGSEKIRSILWTYIKALAISAVGIWIMVSILNGNAFISGFELFRGVKLLYIPPMVLVTLHIIWQNMNLDNTKAIGRLLKQPVAYWHVIVVLIVAAVGMYYVSRTGNMGSAGQLELLFRQGLEELLYVRPRTKEFLIGFPLFILALYVMRRHRIWGSVLLIPGTIGFLSIVNTFTHLHIPLDISILRTVYSVVFGFIIGLVLILLYKLVYKLISKAIKSR